MQINSNSFINKYKGQSTVPVSLGIMGFAAVIQIVILGYELGQWLAAR